MNNLFRNIRNFNFFSLLPPNHTFIICRKQNVARHFPTIQELRTSSDFIFLSGCITCTEDRISRYFGTMIIKEILLIVPIFLGQLILNLFFLQTLCDLSVIILYCNKLMLRFYMLFIILWLFLHFSSYYFKNFPVHIFLTCNICIF